MIRTSQELVKHFMVSKGYMPDPPELPVQVDAKLAEQRHDYLAEENREYLDAVHAGDLTATADAIADQLYIVLGTAVAHGIDLQPIFDAVHRSNMTKQGVDPVTGKGSKGPDYVPPTQEIAAELLKQITGLADAPEGELKTGDDDGAAELNAWTVHMEGCAKCRPHLGHVPFGLCEEGRHLFFSLEAPVDTV